MFHIKPNPVNDAWFYVNSSAITNETMGLCIPFTARKFRSTDCVRELLLNCPLAFDEGSTDERNVYALVK